MDLSVKNFSSFKDMNPTEGVTESDTLIFRGERRYRRVKHDLRERPMHERPVLLNVVYKTRTEG